MKRSSALAALVVLVSGTTAHAASLSVNSTDSFKTHAIYLSGEAQNGAFNTVIFSAVPLGGGQFLALSSGVGKPAGDPNTYRNRALDADPLDGGLGWSLVGTQTTATALTFSGGPLGSNITTADQPGGRLFLANLRISLDFNHYISVQLVDATGAQVGPTLDTFIPGPEPSSCGLAGIAMLGLAAVRRRVA